MRRGEVIPRTLSVLLVAAFACASPVFAHTTSAIAGVVKDPTGGVLPGVTVEAIAGPGSKVHVTATRGDGSYRLEDLAPAAYRVSFRLGAGQATVKEGVAVTLEGVTRLDATVALTAKESIVVTGRRALKDLAAAGEYAQDLVGIADAATEGTIGRQAIEDRPTTRPTEVLEAVPGLVITQHSGEGKANQYYLRGFNLDHGTDLSSDVAGVPVNMPTHAHGQGYSDLNFLIPELVSSIQFRKGPYYADEGDFSAAGAVHVNLLRSLEHGLASVEVGSFGHARALVADSFPLAGGDLLAALEGTRSDGPWDHPDGARKLNVLVGYSRGTVRNGFQISALLYDAKWDSTDQIPRRAVHAGTLSRFGTVDPTDGGRTHRDQLSAQLQKSDEGSVFKASVYAMAYGLDLYSDFTYFLDDPVHGDQIEQEDRRVVTGFSASRQWLGTLASFEMENTVGVSARNDNVTSLGLFHDEKRDRLSTKRHDHVAQTSGAIYAQNATTWTPFLRSTLGLRGDFYRFKVGSDDPRNAGTETAGLLSPKVGLVIGPFAKTEIYLNGGYGFHSNDGRGATLTVSPVTGEPVPRVSPLVRAKGAELGARTAIVPGLETTASLWILDLDSELVFSGDAGETEASRASRRHGVEISAAYRPFPGLTLDADLSFSRARFKGASAEGNEIPGALEDVFSAGAAYDGGHGLFGSARVRYFGPRPLSEDGRVRSSASTTVDARFGYEKANRWKIALEALNLLDAKVSDVDYFYRSRLPGEPAEGVDDVHFHPAEPFSLRVAATLFF